MPKEDREMKEMKEFLLSAKELSETNRVIIKSNMDVLNAREMLEKEKNKKKS